MKKKLFQYTVLFHEFITDEKGNKVYKDSSIIIAPTFALAETEKEIVFKATREISEEHAKSPDNVEILIRNF